MYFQYNYIYTQLTKEFKLITSISGVNEQFRKAWLTKWAKQIIAMSNIDVICSIYDNDDYHQEHHDDILMVHIMPIDVELIYG